MRMRISTTRSAVCLSTFSVGGVICVLLSADGGVAGACEDCNAATISGSLTVCVRMICKRFYAFVNLHGASFATVLQSVQFPFDDHFAQLNRQTPIIDVALISTQFSQCCH